MTDLLNNLCDGFNNYIGRVSQTFLPKEQYETKKTEANNWFSDAANGIANAAIYERDKAIRAYNIKATIYNVATVVAIASVVALIFTGPGALIPLAIGLAGRWFVDHAMQRTVFGGIGNQYQAIDKSIYSLLFKSYIRWPKLNCPNH